MPVFSACVHVTSARLRNMDADRGEDLTEQSMQRASRILGISGDLEAMSSCLDLWHSELWDGITIPVCISEQDSGLAKTIEKNAAVMKSMWFVLRKGFYIVCLH